MDHETVKKILDIQDKMRSDPEYELLLADYEQYMGEFLEIMQNLPERQHASLQNFLGAAVALHLKMLELACNGK